MAFFGDPSGPRSPVLKWGWRAVKLALAIILIVHLYLLALRFLPVPGTILMTQRAMAGETVRKDWTPLSKISPHLVRAVIAGEDAKYCEHGGIDWEAIEKARAYNERNAGKKRRGGSTITQQTAKNVFFWNGGGMVRKAGEAWFSLAINTVWGKRRTMEVYLNVAEWGDGLFGAEAAAQARFGKAAANLTEREAALLAAVLPSPNKWRVDPPGPYVQKRTGSLQARMRVVQSEGFAACVLGDEPKPAPRPQTPKGETPPPVIMPELPEDPTLETYPEEVPGVAEQALPPEEGSDDALNDLLDAADETFTVPTDPAPVEPVDAGEGPMTAPPEDLPAETAPEASGPKELRPAPSEPETQDPVTPPPTDAPSPE